MSFKPEVFVDNQWASNAVAFDTEEEASISARELYNRWFLCKDWRVVESTDPVNYQIVDGVMTSVG